MTVTLPIRMDEAVERRARTADFSTPDEFVSDSMKRILVENSSHEAAVLKGLRSGVSRRSADDPTAAWRPGTRRRCCQTIDALAQSSSRLSNLGCTKCQPGLSVPLDEGILGHRPDLRRWIGGVLR